MSEHLTRGINCATLTPIEQGAPCIDLLVAHCQWLIDAGCEGIVLLGTTGEANSFTVAERKAILDGALAGGISAENLIVGTGCTAVGDTVELTKQALSNGVTRCLMLPPFYYKNVSDAGVVAAYSRAIEAVADARLRVYLYQIPQLTGVSLGPIAVTALQRAYPGTIAGIKDSSGDVAAITELCVRFGEEIDVLAGSERYLLAALRAGASGCVTAAANANAAQICALYRKRDDSDAAALQSAVAAA
ncbi:MAG TPA: dihydrodipicolinate synthase family protein, partial [Candidatus Eremiobacteraceae bacterium]|nr:dihydrodipicolinate synthase family protein [Candidatus Eremiobacteraceae bacterium]